MDELRPVRGTKDLLPEDAVLHEHITNTAKDLFSLYGYEQLFTPIFEFTEVFKRSLGDTSDVVNKEMYTFEDRGGESLTLRPEFTAGICRAFITNGLQQRLPLKLFSYGPLFRYERPQKGRLRQFHQLNIECLGVASPKMDAELISMAALFLDKIGVLEVTTLEINSLGCSESRNNYRDALVTYFSEHKPKLSEDSLLRLEKNPLRILDSKDEGDKAIVAKAPIIEDHYTSESKKFFDEVLKNLDMLGVKYIVNRKLVRGLDYYTHTAFEFTTTKLGAQGTVLAGGRYDGLVELLKGPSTSGVGFASGIERLALLIDKVNPSIRPISIVPIGDECEKSATILVDQLRKEGFSINYDYDIATNKRLKRANKVNAKAVIFIGEEEIKKGIVKVKDFDLGTEEEVKNSNLIDYLGKFRA